MHIPFIDQRDALARYNDIGDNTIKAIARAKVGAIGNGDTIPTRSLHLGPLDQEYVLNSLAPIRFNTDKLAINGMSATGQHDPFKHGQVGGSHYEKMAIQPFEYSMANRLDPMQHTIVKYVTRFREKNGIEDLKKARHVIDLLIAHEQKTNPQGSK